MYGPTTERIDLPIEGMSCAACAGAIERRLNRLEGVEATVNYATERATVRFDAGTRDARRSRRRGRGRRLRTRGCRRPAAGEDDALRCAAAASSPPSLSLPVLRVWR